MRLLYINKKHLYQDYITVILSGLSLYNAHQRQKPATAGGWCAGVGERVRPSQEVSRVFGYPNFLSCVIRS